jgi:hypothetical protein
MSTVVDLTDQELSELQMYTKAPDAAAAVRLAMNEFLRYARRMELKAASGRIAMEDNWQSLESAELEGRHADSGSGDR